MDNPDHYKYMPHLPGEEEREKSEEENETQAALSDLGEEPVATDTTPEPAAYEDREETAPEKTVEPELEEWQPVSPEAMMLKGFMKFIYDLFNPFLIASYATLLIFELSILSVVVPGGALVYPLTVFGATCLFPVLALIVMKSVKIIGSMNLEKRSERVYPYIIELIAMGAVTVFFFIKGAPSWLWLIYCGASATILINLLINFKIKVSNHCSAIAGLLAVFMAIQGDGVIHEGLGWWAIGTIIMAGIIGSIAILFGRHSLKEVLAGYITGFLPIALFTLIH